MADITDTLWSFIRLASHLSYSDLCETPPYAAMSDAVHSSDHGARLTVRIGDDGDGDGVHLVPPLCASWLQVGVEWDERSRSFEFADVDTMFAALPALLSPSCPAADRDALMRCRARIADTLRTFEVAELLGGGMSIDA